ncbi:MAG: hypothetical protein ACR2HX_14530 [Pyrinomonadaceae bacterium]
MNKGEISEEFRFSFVTFARVLNKTGLIGKQGQSRSVRPKAVRNTKGLGL